MSHHTVALNLDCFLLKTVELLKPGVAISFTSHWSTSLLEQEIFIVDNKRFTKERFLSEILFYLKTLGHGLQTPMPVGAL